MRKLAIAAMSLSVGIFAANYIIPVGWLIVPAVVCAVGGAALALLREKWLRPAVISLMFVSLGFLVYHVQYKLTVEKAEQFTGQTMTLTVQLTSYPVNYGDYCRAEVLIEDGEIPHFRALLYDNSGSISNAEPGQYAAVTGKVSAANKYYGESYDRYYSKNILLKISTKEAVTLTGGRSIKYLPEYINEWILSRIDTLFPSDISPFMKSLLIGEKRDFYADARMKSDLSRAGLSHVIAISGMHVAFFASFVQFFFGKTRRSSILCIILIWLFTLVTGAGPSTVRAAFMHTLWLLAPIVYRENDRITSLSAILALLLIVNPLSAKSLSLQLSFAAMVGIICLAKPVSNFLLSLFPDKLRKRAAYRVCGAASMSFAALAATTPLTAVYFGSYPVLSILSNIIVFPMVSACFFGGISACALSVIPPVGGIAAWLVSWIARGILAAAHVIAKFPFSVLYTQTSFSLVWIIIVYVVFIAAAFIKIPRIMKIIVPTALSACALAFVLHLTVLDYTAGDSTISVIDVGQGQCIAVMDKDCTVVIDCGSSSGVDAGEKAGQYLLSCGRTRIDTLIFTHLHEDHANGAELLLELLPVDMMILPWNADEYVDMYEKICTAAERNDTELVYIGRETSVDCGNIHMKIIPPMFSDSKNETGQSMLVSVGEYEMLVTGDASYRTEKVLTEICDLSDVDLIIVGHHGAETSSCDALLTAVGGSTAVISTGYNFYGHPAPETIDRYEKYGYNVYRTDLNGTVEIRIG